MKVRLEIDHIRVLRKKQRWLLYFLVVFDNPADPTQKVVKILPEYPVQLKNPANNLLETDFTFDFEIQPYDTVNFHLYVRHCGGLFRKVTNVLSKIADKIGSAADATNVLAIPAEVANQLSEILREIPDRDMGWVNLTRDFTPDFVNVSEKDYDKPTSTGEIEVVYSWQMIHE